MNTRQSSHTDQNVRNKLEQIEFVEGDNGQNHRPNIQRKTVNDKKKSFKLFYKTPTLYNIDDKIQIGYGMGEEQMKEKVEYFDKILGEAEINEEKTPETKRINLKNKEVEALTNQKENRDVNVG